MNWETVNCFFEKFNPLLEGVVHLLGIVGGVCGFFGFLFGKKAKKKAEECEKTLTTFSTKIDTIHDEVKNITNNVHGNNAQIAEKIVNKGLDLQDVDYQVNKVVDERTKYMPQYLVEDENGEMIENPIISISK